MRFLREIDENLIRNELTPAERAAHTARRIELVKNMAEAVSSQPETKIGRGRPKEGGSTQDIANMTGRSKAAVKRDARRGKALGRRNPDPTRELAGFYRLQMILILVGVSGLAAGPIARGYASIPLPDRAINVNDVADFGFTCPRPVARHDGFFLVGHLRWAYCNVGPTKQCGPD